MSGREHEPVAAFFPSIDRNLILDLDRHLREAQNALSPRPTAPLPANTQGEPHGERAVAHAADGSGRAGISDILKAIEHAGRSMAAMGVRIDELEGEIAGLHHERDQLRQTLATAEGRSADLEARLAAEQERAGRVEAVAAQQAARAATLDRELASAHDDLARITDTIAATLGVPSRH